MTTQWYKALSDWIHDLAGFGVFTTDADLRITSWNRWLEERSGRPASEVVGERLNAVFPEIGERGLLRYYDAALNGQVSMLSQRFHGYLISIPRDPNGSATQLMQQTARVAPLSSEGHVIGTVTVIEDVSERVEREQELRQQVEALESLNRIAQSILTLDLARCLREVARTAAALTGAEVSVVVLNEENATVPMVVNVGLPIEPGCILDETSVAAQAMNAATIISLDDDKADQVAQPLHPASRSSLGVPLQAVGRVFGALVIEASKPHAFDGLARLQAERLATQASVAIHNAEIHTALRSSEREMRALFSAMQDWVATADRQGTCLSVAPTRTLAPGNLATQDLVGKSMSDFFPAATAQSIIRAIGQVLDSGKTETLEVQTSAEWGSRWVSVSITPLSAESVLWVGRDITEHKQMEAQFIQAQKMGAVGRLAGGVAHDLNNQLTAILGYAYYARESCPPGSQAYEDISGIISTSERAAALIKRLMLFSRHQVMNLQPLRLNDLIADLSRMLRRLIGEDVELVVLLGEEVGTVQADPVQIEQMLVNLVINARDAITDGGKIVVETRQVDLAAHDSRRLGIPVGRYALLRVSDTGCGMSDEVKEHLFEPFFTTKEVGKGTGLGLATVYGIVQRHLGHIRVESEVGKGTTFDIYLPAQAAAAARVEQPAARRELPRGSESVLIVEDEPTVREMLRRYLGGLGYRVLEASNGSEALRFLKETGSPIDVLLTDVVMPEMGGFELARKVKELQPEIKILFVSGYSADEETMKAIGGRAAAFVSKPFNAATLASALRGLLDG